MKETCLGGAGSSGGDRLDQGGRGKREAERLRAVQTSSPAGGPLSDPGDSSLTLWVSQLESAKASTGYCVVTLKHDLDRSKGQGGSRELRVCARCPSACSSRAPPRDPHQRPMASGRCEIQRRSRLPRTRPRQSHLPAMVLVITATKLLDTAMVRKGFSLYFCLRLLR